MKAMIFAAGLGTRLRPLTDNCPKALVEVGGKPMLGRVMQRLIDAGVTEAVVNVHHFAGMIKEYLTANNNFGITVHVSDESDLLLDTGGGILRARQWLDGGEPFIVHNADILSDVDLAAMYRAHEASGADATLLVAHRQSSRYLAFGNADSRLHGWINTTTGQTAPRAFCRRSVAISPFGFRRNTCRFAHCVRHAVALFYRSGISDRTVLSFGLRPSRHPGISALDRLYVV